MLLTRQYEFTRHRNWNINGKINLSKTIWNREILNAHLIYTQKRLKIKNTENLKIHYITLIIN